MRVERPETVERHRERKALRRLVPGYEELRRALRAEIRRGLRHGAADNDKLSAIFEQHGLDNGHSGVLLRLRVLVSLPAGPRVAYYSKACGL